MMLLKLERFVLLCSQEGVVVVLWLCGILVDIVYAPTQTFPRSKRIIFEKPRFIRVMARIFSLVIDEPAEEALERFTYCFGLDQIRDELTQWYVVETEVPTWVDVRQFLVISLLFILNYCIIKTSLTAIVSCRKWHNGFLVAIRQFLFSLGTSSYQGLELRTFSRRIVIMLGGLVWTNFIIVLNDLTKSISRSKITLILSVFFFILFI